MLVYFDGGNWGSDYSNLKVTFGPALPTDYECAIQPSLCTPSMLTCRIPTGSGSAYTFVVEAGGQPEGPHLTASREAEPSAIGTELGVGGWCRHQELRLAAACGAHHIYRAAALVLLHQRLADGEGRDCAVGRDSPCTLQRAIRI